MITWRIPVDGRFEADLVLRMLANHAVPGVEVADPAAGRHRRLINTAAGPTPVSLRLNQAGVEVAVHDHDLRSEVDERVRRWFDLDADLEGVHQVLRTDPTLAPMIISRPGLRILEYPDPFEAAIVTVLGQQVSVAAARTFAGRLVTAYGAPGPSGLTCFPTAERLVAADFTELRSAVGVTNARARTVQAVAAAFRGRSDAPLDRSELLALPGVGPWTADYLAVRSTGDRDAFPAGDLVLRQAMGGIDARAAAARSEAWRPFRAYALFHLWVSAAYL
jgi:AraC family transcriptional regulator of adaptative response / DNA-3-methyladenine glycosylase II